MACVLCENGVWICEEGTERPKCGPQVMALQSWNYQGRYRICRGEVVIWCRAGDDVAISTTTPLPLPNPRPAWKSAGTIPFTEQADYDIWRKPGENGERCQVMIVQVETSPIDQECAPADDSGQKSSS